MLIKCPFYLPLKRNMTFHLNKLDSSLPKDALCLVELKLTQCFWRTNLLPGIYIVTKFSLLCYYFHLEKGAVLQLNPFHSRMLSAKFCSNWPGVLEVFSLFCYNLYPPKKKCGPHRRMI